MLLYNFFKLFCYLEKFLIKNESKMNEWLNLFIKSSAKVVNVNFIIHIGTFICHISVLYELFFYINNFIFLM